MKQIPRPHEIYRHFKGSLYQIMTVAEHSETGEQLVIYQALYGDYRTYARPLSMFMEKVDRQKYPDAAQESRFELFVPEGQQKSETERNGEAKQETGAEWKTGPKPPLKQVESGTVWKQTRPGTVQGQAEPETAWKQTEQTDDSDEEMNLDPMVLQFLDADTYEERLNILAGLHHRITDDMINVMAMATDIEVKPGEVEDRYAELRGCLMKLEKFECNRLR